MYKKLIGLMAATPLAIAGGNAFADATVSGFADVVYVLTDEAADLPGPTNPNEGKFTATGELDFVGGSDKASVRADLDLSNTGGTSFEQAFVDWKFSDMVGLKAGIVNSMLGWELQDAVDMYTTSHGQLFDVLSGQDAVNVAGLVLSGTAGMINWDVGFLNDIGGVDEENSMMIRADGDVMDGLNLEFGYVTQDNDLTAAGNIYDLNLSYTGMAGLTAAFEFLSGDAQDNTGLVDTGWGLLANYDFGNGFGVTGRWDSVSYQDFLATPVEDTESMTLVGTYSAADNLDIFLEWRSNDNGVTDNDLLTLEFIAALP